MFNSIRLYLMLGITVGICLMGFYGYHLRSHNQQLKADLSSAQAKYNSLNQQLQNILTQRDQLQQIDQQHTKALYDAQTHLNQLRHQLAVGQQRLLVHNIALTPDVSKTSSPGKLGHATACRLNQAGEQDYLTLLQLINQQQQQILYLQHYAKMVSQ